jgi:hypothetical protein
MEIPHMHRLSALVICVVCLAWCALLAAAEPEAQKSSGPLPDLERLKYQSPGLQVDLGVGLWAWPLPMDWENDGDLDLVVSCPDVPSSGTWLFENPGSQEKMPIFKPPVRVGPALSNATPSYVDGQVRVLTPGHEQLDFRRQGFTQSVRIFPRANIHPQKVRANQWRYVDYDGDGLLDLVVGVGDWTDYGWDNAFDRSGHWTRGPLHGFVYLLRNTGTQTEPQYAEPVFVQAGEGRVDVFGMPSPNFADFDGDGDLDLLCGEFLDKFTYFQNTGTRQNPRYAKGQRLMHAGQPLAMDLEMIVPVAIDWDSDGDIDLIVGDEDGRVAFIEHTGQATDGVPDFLPPRYFQQIADDVKIGALVSPCSVDWDSDGDEDLICGNSAGYLLWLENEDGADPPRWSAPKFLKTDDDLIRIQAGPNGSIQGPCEAKWGYTTLSAADWNTDGLPDLVVNSIWGQVTWYQNVGQKGAPRLKDAQPIRLKLAPGETSPKPTWLWWDPEPGELVTQWRTTPCVIDLNQDKFPDLVMLDQEGYLAFFERRYENYSLPLLPGKRIFLDAQGKPLRLNSKSAGGSGRRKFCFTDWDGDGRLDLMLDSKNVNFWKNISTRDGIWQFEDQGPVSSRRLAGHDTSPTPVDWNHDGHPDLVIGAEDGRLYYLRNPHTVLTSGR